jgi:hypothetical protein
MRKVFNVTISVLKTPVTAAYRKEGGRWLCTALEFDLVGIGQTRAEASAEMQQLVDAYLKHAIERPGRVKLQNPSESEEHTGDEQRYLVAIVVTKMTPGKPVPPVMKDFAALRRFRNRIRGVNLVPAGV